MTGPRLYLAEPLEVGKELPLPKEAAHHLTRVLRLTAGAPIRLFNGEGGEYSATLTACAKDEARVRIDAYDPVSRSAPYRVHLGLCILKRDAMTAVLGRATELGVSIVTPLLSEHCTVPIKALDKRLGHWQKTVIAACEQCGLNSLPTVNEPCPLPDYLSAKHQGHCFIALPEAAPARPAVVDSDFSLVVGPEGGFAAQEVRLASEAGFQPISLGPRTLRAETAPLAALAMLMPF